MKKTFSVLLCAVFLLPFLNSQKYDDFVLQGFESYRNRDWTSAMFFFRKQGPSVIDEEPFYMLIMSEIYAGDYKSALSDIDMFEKRFKKSRYIPFVQYQKGRCLHFTGQNEDAVLVLSDFCARNPDGELYGEALFWIAESFYDEYNFESARALYERIVVDFPSNEKFLNARYRIEMIEQREREEKLLYLIKVTGEENLASREDYERQLRLYKTEDEIGIKKQLNDAQLRIRELENLLAAEKSNSESLQKEIDKVSSYDPEVEALKFKARQLQFILGDMKESEESK